VSLNVSDDLRTLRIRGFIVDTIAFVAPNILEFRPRTRTSGPLIWATPEEEGRNLRMLSELHATAAVATRAFQYSDGETRHRQLARTLIYDILTTGEAADVDGAYKVWQYLLALLNLTPLAPGADDAAIMREYEETRKPDGVRMEQFEHSWFMFGVGRSICTTAGGDFGRVPFGTTAGDLVCVFKGGAVPYLLRKYEGCFEIK
jgi:hypothetical protein